MVKANVRPRKKSISMKSLPAYKTEITPFFDLEIYMFLSGKPRLSGQDAARLEKEWHRLFNYLRAYQLGQRKGYLLIYMDSSFQQEVEEKLDKEPDIAEELQILAQAMIMASMKEIIPQANLGSCAPVPKPNKILKNTLKQLDLEFYNSGRLSVQYGVITKLPYSNDCEKCYIKDTCPKRIMNISS